MEWKSKKLVPVITESAFRPRQPIADHWIQETIQFLAIRHVGKEHGGGIYYRTGWPDGQLHQDSFSYEEDTVYYRPEEIDLKRGMRVCIHGGKFDNVKGMFVRVQGKRNRRVVVLLEGVMAVSAEVHPDLIEVLS